MNQHRIKLSRMYPAPDDDDIQMTKHESMSTADQPESGEGGDAELGIHVDRPGYSLNDQSHGISPGSNSKSVVSIPELFVGRVRDVVSTVGAKLSPRQLQQGLAAIGESLRGLGVDSAAKRKLKKQLSVRKNARSISSMVLQIIEQRHISQKKGTTFVIELEDGDELRIVSLDTDFLFIGSTWFVKPVRSFPR